MTEVTLGRTGITVNKNGFGALPIQRISIEESQKILKKAFQNGITFFDTARFYTDSEEKIGNALSDVRSGIILASKTMASTPEDLETQLLLSLKALRTDYLDLYQFHNPAFCPRPGDGTGLYEAMLHAKESGLIRHIGITNHRLNVAMEAANSGLYETIQFPFSYLATQGELDLVDLCRKNEIGFISMKALSGGLITNARAAFAFQMQFDHVLPIWGIQKESELDDFLALDRNPPVMDSELSSFIHTEKNELSGNFCRGCGYCMPCPAGIEISTCARMSLMIRRAPLSVYLSEEWINKMKNIKNCIHCNHCSSKCPYGLDTPHLLEENLKDYQNFIPK